VLRNRILTALVLLPLVIAAIYLLPLGAFALAFWIVVALAAWEWSALVPLASAAARGTYLAALAALCAAAWFAPILGTPLLLAAAVLWLIACALVVRYPRSGDRLSQAAIAGAGIVILGAAWTALVTIRALPAGAHWVLWLMLVVWAADIGAYFAGRRFGHRKLAPAVSPGKTWEGVAGGAGLALLVGTAVLALLGALRPVWLPVLALLIAVSILGDLFESVLKRHQGVKDSGSLLPGHGGVLDRVDSLIAVLPFFALLAGPLAG
jgi:phosphatidate cytidylyltransferase